ncbi:MAG: hypothetical protein ABFS18_06345 [Thermodesulfobacteriota bacterium]
MAPVNAKLIYTGTILTEEDSAGSFRQISNHNLSLSLNQRVTNFLSVNESVRYSSRLAEPLPNKEQLSPSIDVVDDNLLFRLNLSMSSIMKLENKDALGDFSFKEMAFRSKWQSDLFPVLQVVVSQRKDRTSLLTGGANEEDRSLSTTLEWRRDALTLYYNYHINENLSAQGELLLSGDSHNGNLRFNKSYWDRKLQVGFKQEYTNSKRVREGTATSLGLFRQSIQEVRVGQDITPADAFEDPAVVSSPGMLDGNLTAMAYAVASNSSFNNIMLALDSPVDQIYLYTLTDLSGFSLNTLTWSLFTNDILGTGWDPVTPSITGVTYNGGMRRFEINTVGISAKYLKLVLDIPLTGPAIDFTEVWVVDTLIAVTDGSARNSTISHTALNLSGRLSANWSFNYHANLEIREQTRGTVTTNDNEQLTMGGDFKYNSTDNTFSSVVGCSILNNKEDRGTIIGDEQETVRYSVGLDKQFLPTLSSSFDWNLSTVSVASVRVAEASLYRLDSHAQLYPDLDLDFLVESRESKIFQDYAKTSTILAEVALSSRLRPGLYLSLKEGYVEQKSDSDLQSYASSLIMQWRFSDDLYFHGAVSYTDDTADSNPVNLSLNMDLVLTENVLLGVTYSLTKAENDSQVGDVSLNWYPKKGFRLESGGKYSLVSDQTQTGKNFLLYGSLSVNFAMP